MLNFIWFECIFVSQNLQYDSKSLYCTFLKFVFRMIILLDLISFVLRTVLCWSPSCVFHWFMLPFVLGLFALKLCLRKALKRAKLILMICIGQLINMSNWVFEEAIKLLWLSAVQCLLQEPHAFDVNVTRLLLIVFRTLCPIMAANCPRLLKTIRLQPVLL